MKPVTKHILAVAGVISAVVGIAVAVPSVLKEFYLLSVGGVLLLVIGLILLAISFGE